MYTINNFLGPRFPRIRAIIDQEYSDLNTYINLIGSANYPFPSVLKALDTPFGLNPSEGSRGHRFFPHCASLDELESLGENLCRSFFQAPNYDVNLEAYSGTQANHAVYQSILRDGDRVLAMASSSGGHVSHNAYVGERWNLSTYSVDEDGVLDYEALRNLSCTIKPKLIIAGCSSYPKKIDYPAISRIAKECGAYLLADISHTALYVATGYHPSPFGYADFVTFTTHKTTRGIRGGVIMNLPEYTPRVNRAIFPLEQGAPKANEILAKVVMFSELREMDSRAYMSRILDASVSFQNFFRKQGFHLFANGSDSHLIVLDLRAFPYSGKHYEELLEESHILVNRNQIPNDPRSPYETSAIRIGVLTLATMAMCKEDQLTIADMISTSINSNTPSSGEAVQLLLSKYRIVA